MLTIKLYTIATNGGDIEGSLREVGPHPYFMDYPDRDIDKRYDPTTSTSVTETKAVVTVDFNNALAPVLLEMHDRPVRDSVKSMPKVRGHREYGGLENATRYLRKMHPHRKDGIRVGELLTAWAEAHPHSAWSVTADPNEAEILAARSLSEHIAATAEMVLPAMRIRRTERAGVVVEQAVPDQLEDVDARETHDPDACPLIGATDGDDKPLRCGKCNAVGDRGLQPDVRTPGHGGGAGTGKAKDARPMRAGSVVAATVHDIKTRHEGEVARWEANEAKAAASAQARADDEDARTRPKVALGRVSEDVHRALVTERTKDDPSVGDLMECVGRAVIAGVSYREIKEELAALAEKKSDAA